MGLAENRAKAAKMAKDLIQRGYPHGRRQTKPYPNSGGLTMTWGAGSSKYQRLQTSKLAKPSTRTPSYTTYPIK
jgi:hypothetical protein